jgi:hypothetical protein
MKRLIFKVFLLIAAVVFTAKLAAQYQSPIAGWPNTGSYLGYGVKFPASYHNARDIPASVGTKVVAVLDGEVVYNQEAQGFGGLNPAISGGAIVLKHKNDQGQYFYAIYGHINRSLSGGSGTRVQKGQTLGTIRTFKNGSKSLPHLHFGIFTGRTFPTSQWGYPSTLSGWTEPDDYLRNNCKGNSNRYNGYPVDVAKNIQARVSQGTMVLSWNKVSNADAYRIHISTSNSGFSPEQGLRNPLINTTSVTSFGSQTKGYNYTDGRAGQTYYFTVRYNAPGVGYSAFSTPHRFTMPGSSSTNNSGSSNINNSNGGLPSPPTGMRAASKNGIAAILWNEVTGASAYEIQLSQSSRGWSKSRGLTNTIISTSSVKNYRSGQKYYDYRNGRKGQRYYYSVRVKDRSGKWSEYTSPMSFIFN